MAANCRHFDLPIATAKKCCYLLLRNNHAAILSNIIPNRAATAIYGLAIGAYGVMHFIHTDVRAEIIPDYMPGDPKIWVYIVGAALIAASLAILLHKLTRLACYLLAFMLLIFVFTIHLPKALDGDLRDFLKDIGLAMAAIIIGNNAKHGNLR